MQTPKHLVTYLSAIGLAALAHTGVARAAQTPIGLSTETGIEVGGQLSNYRYQEETPAYSNFVRGLGVKGGITATGTLALGEGFFTKADLRAAYSHNSYSSHGSPSHGSIPNFLGEARLLAGKDFAVNDAFSVSPYTGFGYRNLYDDMRALGAGGYERDSQYFYLPVGVTPRFRVGGDARISTDLEYDQLLHGQQFSALSEAAPGASNVTNGQQHGYGLRTNIMYEHASWSAGPFFNYWNIGKSDTGPNGGNEPHNQTVEYGMQVRYRF